MGFMSGDTDPNAVAASTNGHAQPAPQSEYAHHREVPEFHVLNDLRGLEPPEWLVEEFIEQGGMGMLTGAPGSGKSFMATSWGLAVASGSVNAWEGYPIRKHGTVLYVIAEGREGFWERIAAWCYANGVSIDEVKEYFVPWMFDPQLNDPYEMEFLINRAQMIKPELIILDTKARVTARADENSMSEQSPIVNSLQRLQYESGNSSLLLVHHPSGRDGIIRPRGSTVWDGALSHDLRLTREDGLMCVHCEKHKNFSSGCDHRFESKKTEIPASMRREASFFDVSTSPVIFAAHPEEKIRLGGSLDQTLLKVLDDNDRGKGVSVSDLCSSMETRMHASKDSVWGAINRLLRAHYLEEVKGVGERYRKVRNL